MPWILAVATASGIFFGAALIMILISSRIDLRSFDVMESIAARWDRLVVGLSSVSRGRTATVSLYSIGVWALEAVALGSVVRSFAVSLSPAEILMLLGLASLSTLLPNAPGYVGTFPVGILAATAIQIFFFGTVTLLGGLVLLSRSAASPSCVHTSQGHSEHFVGMGKLFGGAVGPCALCARWQHNLAHSAWSEILKMVGVR
jgi:uncharacterized membrane protein YbhN (UPF0104 family)